MKLVVCTDTRGGMMFNKRRTASDRLVTMDIIREGNGRLLITPYSEKIFIRAIEAEDFSGDRGGTHYTVCENPLAEAGDEDTVFIEDIGARAYLSKIHTIIHYNWNIPYPFDTRLDIDPEADGFSLCRVDKFPGNSHDIVTKSVFRRNS